MFKEENPYARAERYIKTTCGCVRGRRCITIYGHHYYSFERIPYAAPPIGELRFKAPVPVKQWFTLLNCTEPAEPPLQHNFLTNVTSGNEDCLFVNVYVKKFNTDSPLPVMVYLFEGGFERGDPTRTRHAPDYFMSRNIVLITIGYRVGVLGFLSFEDPELECPGNAGLKDQLLGLKWAKDNAKRFNGDPNNITLFGCSAGAASAHYHLMSPLAKGLFHKVILQSGSALCPWALCTTENAPLRLAVALGYKGTNCDDDIFKFLHKISGEKLVKIKVLAKQDTKQGHIFAFGPVVEPYRSANCIIPHQPEVLQPKAWGNQIPMMIGATSSEGLLFKYCLPEFPDLIDAVRNNPKLLLPRISRENFTIEKQEQVAEQIRELHFGDKPINKDNSILFCEFLSFLYFWQPIHRTIIGRQRYSYVPTYVYRFDFDSPTFNLYRIKYCPPTERGAVHCDDLSYLFFNNDSWKLESKTPELQNVQRMIAIWTRFAKFSNPNCRTLTACKWAPIERNENEPISCFNISHQSEFMKLPEHKKLSVWDEQYKQRFDYD